MQLTADPQGTDFLNKRGTGKKKFCGEEQDMLNISMSASLKRNPLVPYKYHKIFITALVIGF